MPRPNTRHPSIETPRPTPTGDMSDTPSSGPDPTLDPGSMKPVTDRSKDESIWLPQHVFEERGMPIGDPVCMSPSTRTIWPLAPPSVTNALQLQCDHRRVREATFNAAAERHFARQHLQQWQSTLADNDDAVSSSSDSSSEPDHSFSPRRVKLLPRTAPLPPTRTSHRTNKGCLGPRFQTPTHHLAQQQRLARDQWRRRANELRIGKQNS